MRQTEIRPDAMVPLTLQNAGRGQLQASVRSAAGALLLLAAWGHCLPQPATSPMAPSEPHEALAFFEGTWTTSDSKPEDDFRETCSWLAEGRRHMVCRSSWRADTGRREGLSIFSFEASSGDYLYHGFRTGGAVVTQRGQRTAQGWMFTAERGSGSERVRTRVTMERTTAARFSFLSEVARGEGPWSVGARFEYIRVGR